MSQRLRATIDSYFQDIYRLTRSLIFHMPSIARAINRELSIQGYPIEEDPYQWRYYKHLRGEYHQADSFMQVRSLDTHELIDFTREQIEDHTQTLREYSRLGSFFQRLVEQYPEQELLIRGILEPIDVEKIIDTPEGTIIFYDPELVEEQEHELIECIEDWAIKFLDRYSNPGFEHTDELFTAARFGVMLAYLPAEIANIRHTFHGSAQAHSFYIRQQLASFGRIDRYTEGLGFNELHFLYRNIKYIFNHAGQKRTQSFLIENLADRRRIPLHAHYPTQITAGAETDEEDEDDVKITYPSGQEVELDTLKPTLQIERRALGIVTTNAYGDRVSIDRMIELQRPLAESNERTWEEDRDAIIDRARSHSRSSIPSKLIDSSVIDRSDVFLFRSSDVTFFSWLYLAYENIYRRRVLMVDPVSGEDVLLTMLDLFIVYLYAMQRSYELNLKHIPDIYALGIQKRERPGLDELRKLTRHYHIDTDNDLSNAISAMRSVLRSYPSYIVSYEGFQDYVSDIHWARNTQYWVASSAEDHQLVAELTAIAEHFWEDHYLPLSNMGTFEDYFTTIGYRIHQLPSQGDLDLIAGEALFQATGLGEDSASRFELAQRNIIKILERTSSYSVQYSNEYYRYERFLANPKGIRHSYDQLSKAGEHHALSPRQPLWAGNHARRNYSMDNQSAIAQRYEKSKRFRIQTNFSLDTRGVERARSYIKVPYSPILTLSVEQKNN